MVSCDSAFVSRKLSEEDGFEACAEAHHHEAVTLLQTE